MAKYTITPWRTPSDLLAVRQQLYNLNSDTRDARRYAVDRVMAWRIRGNLPHAIESTALLIDAFLHHDIKANSLFSIRAVYSAAFCRFVTGFCDIGRHRERLLEPSSMLEIARQIDMPDEFVALRHEATHEDLPSVPRLVAACEEALQWLWRVYWSRLDESSTAKADRHDNAGDEQLWQERRQATRRIFRDYRISRRKLLMEGERDTSKIGQLLESATDELAMTCGTGTKSYKMIAEDLVESRTLFPDRRSLASSLGGAFMIWDDLLQAVCRQQEDFLLQLVNALLLPITDVTGTLDENFREAHGMWLTHIGCSTEWSAALRASNVDIRGTIIRTCIAYPSSWTSAVAQQLLANGCCDADFEEQWRELFEASKIPQNGINSNVESALHQDKSQTASLQVDRAEFGGESAWQRAILPPRTAIGVAGP